MNHLVIILIRIYKRFISPFLPPACRFEPSCSVYARESFERFSFLRALFLTVRRLLRCQPFCKGGLDPVPAASQKSKVESKK